MCDLLNGIMETKYFGMDFSERMDFYKVPGLSLAVVEEGNIQTKCFGVCDKDTRREINDETLFQAASISKVLFAVSVLRLAEAKIIDLDQDIRQYSDVDFYKSFDAKPHVVTFRNLLGHVSGFNISGFTGYLSTMEIPTIEQILRGQFPANNIGLFMQAAPNTGWMYSGGGYILGQKVICDILNETFEHIIREWVLSPLGMCQSTFEQPLDTHIHTNYASGYDVYNMKINGDFCIMPELAAAGLWTTPRELLLLGIELMRAAEGQSNFLTRESIQTMMTKTLPGALTGLGLFVPDENPNGYFEHSGANLGYAAEMCFQIKAQKGLVAMVNSSVSSGFLNELENAVGKLF